MTQQESGNQQGGPRSQQQRLRELQQEQQESSAPGEKKGSDSPGGRPATGAGPQGQQQQGASVERLQGGQPRNMTDDEDRL